MLRKNIKNYNKNYDYIFKRIITITINLYGMETIIIRVHTLTDDTNQQTEDQFY